MEKQIAIEFPESLAVALKMGQSEFTTEIKIISLIKLYELGKISSGVAASLLNCSRIEFLELLGKYNASYIHESMIDQLESDLKNA